MRKESVFLVPLLLGFALGTSRPAAASVMQYEGCYNCGYFGSSAFPECVSVDPDQWGAGYICTERTFPSGTTTCYTNGISCYSITVPDGGGGGGYGGGGGGGCSVAGGAVCPPSCLACSRPAI
jgi:hypothetical protein